MTCTNKTIREISSRQIAFNLDNSQSYFSKVQDILNIYDLPNLQCLSEGLTSKEIWKLQVKRAFNKHWSELLQKEALEKSTLKYMNIHSVGIGRTHSVWYSLESTVSDVRKGITKSRMITGTYMLQSMYTNSATRLKVLSANIVLLTVKILYTCCLTTPPCSHRENSILVILDP